MNFYDTYFNAGKLPLYQKHMKLSAATVAFFRKFIVLWIALIAALVTCVFVPFDADYIGYFDWQTLACLFCTIAVIGAFKNISFFQFLARKILLRFKTTRGLILALVAVTYFGSMIMANDMALITFLPLGYFALSSCAQHKKMAFTFVMQNIAANLGGMLTPFGNPQNLYLYNYFHISNGDFFAVMAPAFALAFVMIAATCLLVKPERISLREIGITAPSLWRSVVYGLLFVLSILIVFRVFPYYWGLLAVVAALLVLDPKAFLRVDYALLLTFCAFFVFSGNLSRIDAVRNALSDAIALNPLLFGVLCTQVMSNVPTAVLLSKFVTDWRTLLLAVNIGGVGTPISSLASLITISEYNRVNNGKLGKYMALYAVINAGFLIVLLGAQFLFMLAW